MELARPLKHLLEVFQARALPARLRSGGVVSHGHHRLLPVALLILVPPVVTSVGQGEVIATITSVDMTSGLGFAAEVGLDRLLTGGILGGNILELPCHARGLMAEHVDKHLASHAIDEGVDDVGVGDVCELILRLPRHRWSHPLVGEEKDDGMRWRSSWCPSLGCLVLDAEQRLRNGME